MPLKWGETSTQTIANLAQSPVQQLLMSEALDDGPSLIFVADDEMRYAAVNLTACRVLGYTREELLGLAVTDVAVAPEAPTLYDEMVRTRSHHGVTPIRTKDGRLLPLTYNACEVQVSGLPYWVSIGHVEDDTGAS
jgi:two-component system, sensor histidine kinase and response regulator